MPWPPTTAWPPRSFASISANSMPAFPRRRNQPNARLIQASPSVPACSSGGDTNPRSQWNSRLTRWRLSTAAIAPSWKRSVPMPRISYSRSAKASSENRLHARQTCLTPKHRPLGDQSRHHGESSNECIVFAMLQVQIQREPRRSLVLIVRTRRKPRQHPRHPPRIFLELWKRPPQKCLFIANHREIDHGEHHNQRHAYPPTLRRHGKSQSHQQRPQIQWVSRVSIRTGSSQRLVLAHMSRSERTSQKSWNNRNRSQRHGTPCRPGHPEIKHRKEKPQRHANPPRDL